MMFDRIKTEDRNCYLKSCDLCYLKMEEKKNGSQLTVGTTIKIKLPFSRLRCVDLEWEIVDIS